MKKVLIAFTFLCAFLSTAFAQAGSAPPQVDRMTLRDAEELAYKNNPQISVAKLLTLAEGQVTRQTRSAEMPSATLNLTAVEPSENGTRITAGLLNNPSVYQRAAGGVTFSQVLTDFGRTRNLVASAKFREQAQLSAERATLADITLATDQAFYRALQAQALLNVAQETVRARQTVADQVNALATAKLKSDLDLSFAKVNLAEAQLMLIDAENRKAEAFASLNSILGYEKQHTYLLIDETGTTIPQPPTNADGLVDQAFHSRPDLLAAQDQVSSANKFRQAEHDLNRPTISALGTVGDTPVRSGPITPWYGAIGVNVSVPVFNGFLFSARAKEADFRASALQERERDLRNRIARDVRVTYLQAGTAYQRISVTEQLLEQANLALDLAQTRYKLGLSSIVELSQAQLQQTQAVIGNTNARYEYLAVLSSLRYQTGQ